MYIAIILYYFIFFKNPRFLWLCKCYRRWCACIGKMLPKSGSVGFEFHWYHSQEVGVCERLVSVSVSTTLLGLIAPKGLDTNGTLGPMLQSETITLDNGFLSPPPPPIPPAQCCFAGWKKIERKVDIIGATLKEGKRGRAFF